MEQPGETQNLQPPAANEGAGSIPSKNETWTLPMDGIAPGKTIASRFRIVRFIGNGGMGDVYEAEDLLPSKTRRVALKTIRSGIASKPQVVKQFEREIALGQLITHPNVCRIHDIGVHRDRPDSAPVLFLTMELLDGTTLSQRLRSSGRMEPPQALPLIRQLAAALDAAHRANIVHRDFKPGNIILVEGKSGGVPRAVVTDFGLALDVADADAQGTQTRSGGGTPDYMSPEQVRAEAVGPASDIYAFGVVVYQMIAGKLPFEGESALQRMAMRLNLPPVPPAVHAKSLPQSWNDAILRCLAMDPADRFPSMQDAIAAFEQPSQTVVASKRLVRICAMAAAVVLLLAILVFSVNRAWTGNGWSASGNSLRSIAVLPFENAGGDAEWQYLADGLTESMINRLARINDLTVMSRSAVFRIKKSEPDAIEQGRRLRVDAILTGSVRHFPDHLEANIELVDCATGRHLWGQQYRQVFMDPLTFEKSAVEDTATKLRARLSATEKQRILRDYTTNTNAFRLYLKGRYEWNKRNRKGYEQAIQYFGQALDADPGYALAYAGMADAYSGENDFLPPSVVFPKAATAVTRALEIDADLPEAHASLGFIHLQYDWDWAKAEAEFQRAIQLNPSYPTAHSMYSRLLYVLGRFPEAEEEVAKAQKLDPLSMGIANGVAFTYYLARDYARADRQFKASLELVPDPVTTSYRALVQVAGGRPAEAIAAYEGILKSDPADLDTMADLTRAYAIAGRLSDAESMYARLDRMKGATASLLPTSYAGASAALKRLDEAFAHLERAYAERCWYLIFLRIDPLFDPIRGDPRYRLLLRKMNLAY